MAERIDIDIEMGGGGKVDVTDLAPNPSLRWKSRGREEQIYKKRKVDVIHSR